MDECINASAVAIATCEAVKDIVVASVYDACDGIDGKPLDEKIEIMERRCDELSRGGALDRWSAALIALCCLNAQWEAINSLKNKPA